MNNNQAMSNNIRKAIERVRERQLELQRQIVGCYLPPQPGYVDVGFGGRIRLPHYQSPKPQVAQAESPLGIMVQAECRGQSTTIEVTPNHGGRYQIVGVRSFNGSYEITIERLVVGEGILRNAGPFDSASYSIGVETPEYFRNPAELAEHRLYYAVPHWGEISEAAPMILTFKAWGNPSNLPFLSWTLYGLDRIEAGRVPPMPPTPQAVAPSERTAADLAAKIPELAAEHRPSPHPWGIPRR